jgi:hypothetical protein
MTREDLLQESQYYDFIKKARRDRWKQEKKQTKEEKDIRTKQWCTFYRRNLNIYISERLRIKLRPFQHIIIYLMSISETFWAICSRGASKTFICAAFAVAWMLLYPKSEIIIVSSVIKQANLIVTEKIEGELMSLSPVLKQMKDDGLIWFKDENDCRCMYAWNGSSIKVLPEAESSRGNRSTFLIAEEARLLTKTKYDSIFREMLRPRNAEYRNISEYQGDEYADKAKEVFLTSAYFKSSWIWTAFKKCVTSCFNDRHDNYNFYASDIYVAIHHGIKTWTEFRKSKSSSDELSFRMETLNEMVGEADGAYYTLEMFQKNQILKKALHPPTNEEFDANVDKKNRKKRDNEYRVLSVDLAFSEDAVGKKEESDRCALEVLSVICKGDGTTERRLEYIESMGGGDEQAVHQRIRELYWDLGCTYLCVDINGGGNLYYTMLSSPWQHPTRQNWNPHGFGICEEPNMQVLSDGVLNELRQRTVDPEYIPCMIPMKATAEMNSNMWKSLWKSLNNGSLLLLEDELQITKELDENAKSVRLTSDERVRYLLPYVQTNLLMNEGINLSATWKDNGMLSLSQPRMGHKDRMSSLQYANWIADKIENNHAISQNQEDFNIDDFAGILI